MFPVNSLLRAGRDDSPLRPNADLMDTVLAYWKRQQYNKNDVVFRPGDSGVTLYCVLEGAFEVCTRDEQGTVFVLDRFDAGDFVGEMGLFSEPAPRGVTLKALGPSVMAEIDSQRLAALLGGTLSSCAGPFLYAVGAQLSRRLRTTTRKAGNLALLDVRGRIQQALWDLGQAPGAVTTADGKQFRISRVTLAQHASCSREMAGRMVTSLEEEGLLRVNGKIITVLTERWPAAKQGETSPVPSGTLAGNGSGKPGQVLQSRALHSQASQHKTSSGQNSQVRSLAGHHPAAPASHTRART
jgi:CRP/FNR family cyclic AMP-dependent transcriptional regulator